MRPILAMFLVALGIAAGEVKAGLRSMLKR